MIREMLSKSVIEFAQKDFPLIDKDGTLSHAFKLMEKYRTDRVLVTDEKTLVGIMTKRDVLGKLMVERTRLSTASKLHVSSFMAHPVFSIQINASMIEAVESMSERGIGSLPVVAGEEVKALLHKIDVARIFLSLPSISAREVLEPAQKISRSGDRLVKLREEFLNNKIVIAPVLDSNNRLIGMVTVSEIADALFLYHEKISESSRKKARREIFVEDVMYRQPLVVSPEEPVSVAAKLMLENRKPGVIVAKKDSILGIITADSLISYIHARAR
ncbi:MAG: CBS domain-containing protein [Fervidicoccaceae archaeon]